MKLRSFLRFTTPLFLAAVASCGVSGGSHGGTSSGDGSIQIEPGQLTAGEWDDNDYFDLFLASLDEVFSAERQIGQLDVSDRVEIRVLNRSSEPLSNALIEVFDDNKTYLSAPTGTDGRLLYLPRVDGAPDDKESLSIRVSPHGGEASMFPAPTGSTWTLELADAPAETANALDIAFVVDTTGSMGDELEYLKSEVASISAAIHRQAETVSLRYALIVYRDEGDGYVVRSFDFTSSLDEFTANLEAQSAAGGGDYPEAMEQAFVAANALDWRSDSNAARILFLIADAPPHDQEAQRFLDEANRARLAGIRTFPVAASGSAIETEYLMRMAAQISLARYIFLTDDSGIGNAHDEPRVPCYKVQQLNTLMVRTALSELTGSYIEASEDDVLRTVGEYEDQRCKASPN